MFDNITPAEKKIILAALDDYCEATKYFNRPHSLEVDNLIMKIVGDDEEIVHDE